MLFVGNVIVNDFRLAKSGHSWYILLHRLNLLARTKISFGQGKYGITVTQTTSYLHFTTQFNVP